VSASTTKITKGFGANMLSKQSPLWPNLCLKVTYPSIDTVGATAPRASWTKIFVFDRFFWRSPHISQVTRMVSTCETTWNHYFFSRYSSSHYFVTVLLLIDCFNHVQGFPGAMTHRLRPCTPRSCTPRSPQAKPPGTTRDFWTSSTGQYALNHFISFSTYANL
jgi:hypothetical protein